VSDYERPQKGNPHALTIKQHILPAHSIARFANANGMVVVHDHKRAEELLLRPTSEYFCVQRAWDQRAEVGYMKAIEDAFQDVADRIISGECALNTDDEMAITQFHALWRLRASAKAIPTADQIAKGIAPEKGFTKDETEILEKNSYLFLDADRMPSRQLVGMRIQVGIDQLSQPLKWGVSWARSGEFLVPDSFGSLAVIPIEPTICLVAGKHYPEMSKKRVAKINKMARRASRQYFFSRDFAKCP